MEILIAAVLILIIYTLLILRRVEHLEDDIRQLRAKGCFKSPFNYTNKEVYYGR